MFLINISPRFLKTAAVSVVAAIMATAQPVAAHGSDSHEVAKVVNPTVPKKVKFAGHDVDLDAVDMAERLDRELTAMAFTHGNTLLTIKRANRYFPEIVPILKREGIPADFAYLACIESYLNPRAVSGAKAAGIWQFMPSTAKEYGLEVNEYVDERYNLEKATAAAAQFLKTAYGRFGNWESAAAAYNGGMGRISTELSAQQAGSAYDLYLNDETSRYIFRLLAMKMIMEHPSRYGFKLTADQLYQPAEYDTVAVVTAVEDWPSWAKERGIDYRILRVYNPWIRAKSLPNKTGKTYYVRIPTEKSLRRSTQKQHVYDKNWIK